MTLAEFESLSLALGISSLVLYMLFVIYKLGKESKAGKFGYFVLFGALGLGLIAFTAKTIVVELLNL